MSPIKIILSEVGCLFILFFSLLLGYMISSPWPTRRELIINMLIGGALGLGLIFLVQRSVVKRARARYSTLRLVGLYTLGLIVTAALILALWIFG